METITVKNCKSCPFSYYEIDEDCKTEYANCLHPISKDRKYNINSYYKNYKSPKWCGLKQHDLLIKFNK